MANSRSTGTADFAHAVDKYYERKAQYEDQLSQVFESARSARLASEQVSTSGKAASVETHPSAENAAASDAAAVKPRCPQSALSSTNELPTRPKMPSGTEKETGQSQSQDGNSRQDNSSSNDPNITSNQLSASAKAAIQAHQAAPGPVIVNADIGQPASSTELKARAAELNK